MSLVWQQWAFLGFAVLEVLCTVGMVGKPNGPVRKPSAAARPLFLPQLTHCKGARRRSSKEKTLTPNNRTVRRCTFSQRRTPGLRQVGPRPRSRNWLLMIPLSHAWQRSGGRSIRPQSTRGVNVARARFSQ